MGHQMKQFNVTQQVFDDLLVEQVSMPIDVPIEIHQTINGKPAVTRIETTNVLTEPRFSTHGDGWIYVPEELIDDVSASITGGGLVWLDDGGAIKCSGAQPSGAHTFDKNTGKWVLDPTKQAEIDAQAAQVAGQKRLTEIEQAIQTHINQTVQSLGMGFTDDASLISKYAGYDNVFRSIAEAVGKWVAGIWYLAGQDKAAIIAGQKDIRTVEEALGQIPLFVMPTMEGGK